MTDGGIQATITAEAASQRRWDVVVAGAGLAGAVLALRLAQSGHAVLLVDMKTFPRAKTCGGTLNPRAVGALARLGLRAVLEDTGPNPITGVEWRMPGQRPARLDFPTGDNSPALAVSRERLDAALLREAIWRGVEFLPGTRCLASEAADGYRTIRLRKGNGMGFHVEASLVAACDGLGSTLAADAGLSIPRAATPGDYIGCSIVTRRGNLPGAPTDRILMAPGQDGYTGTVRVEDGRWDVAAAVRLGALRGRAHPSELALAILARCGVRTEEIAQAAPGEWTVTRPCLRHQLRRRSADRLLLLGDAAGYVEPVTGEGMAWALASVEHALPLLERGWGPNTGDEWEHTWHRHAGKRRGLVRAAGFLVRHPWLARGAMAALAAAPQAGSLLAAGLVRDAGPGRA